MKNIFSVLVTLLAATAAVGQDLLQLQAGGSLTVQAGAALVVQGGLVLAPGSSLLNNGRLTLQNNTVANGSNWTDNSPAGALGGNGIVVFNSSNPQQVTGPTAFYTVYVDAGGLLLNNDLSIANLLRLVRGKISTGNYVVRLLNGAPAALENDPTNAGYANGWINGFLRRAILSNTGSYDFPVGNGLRGNLLQLINNNLTGASALTASFGTKEGTDAGLNATENGNVYTAVNSGGVWKLVPDAPATGGSYALQLWFNGFTGLADNSFAPLRRPDGSSSAADWAVPAGSALEPLNGAGRKLADGFARRYNITGFSQWGIGQWVTAATGTGCSITGAADVCAGSANSSYTAPAGMSSYSWSVTGSAGIAGPANGPVVTVNAAAASGSFTLSLQTTRNGATCTVQKTVAVNACIGACTYSQGLYGNGKGSVCSNGVKLTATQLMLNAFGTDAAQVFGNVANRRFFTLYKTDVQNGNILKMLPGMTAPKVIAQDLVAPYDGAYYDDQQTWYLVPMPTSGQQKGRLQNMLLAQAITLWFNLRTSGALGGISLVDDTLVTAPAACGSSMPAGPAEKFGLPHSLVLYLNSANGYASTVAGLFQLANDVLGSVNTAVSPSLVQEGVATVNEAFEGCRLLVGTIPYAPAAFTTLAAPRSGPVAEQPTGFAIGASPNPSNGQFLIRVRSGNGRDRVAVQVYDGMGRLVEQKTVDPNTDLALGQWYRNGVYLVTARQGSEQAGVKLVKAGGD